MPRQKKAINIKEIIPNDKNPRSLSTKNLKKMKKSIKDFPKMMELRPMVVDENNMIVGGNMRYLALVEMGYKTIPNNWVKIETELTEKQKQEFIIKDNLNFGDWDHEGLKSFFEEDDLTDWGMDTDLFNFEEKEVKEKEIDENLDTKNECPKCGYKW